MRVSSRKKKGSLDMQKRSLNVLFAGKMIMVSFGALFAACAYGVDPDRSSLGTPSGGSGGNVGSSSSGDFSSSSSSSSSSAASSSSSASSSSGASSSSSSSSASSSSGAPPVGLSVQYKAADTMGTTNQLKPHLNITNNGNAAVALDGLSIRYYYTLESNGAQTQEFHCDYAMINCANLSGSFKTTTGMNADHYLEITFTGGLMLAAGSTTGEIQARVNKSDFASNDQTNDYSFDATKIDFATWDKVTLYDGATLVWGTAP